MARFDVYKNPDGSGYLLDVQADLLDHLNTRVVVPLMLPSEAPSPAKQLNPTFQIGTEPVVMMSQFISAVPKSILNAPLTSLENHDIEIIDAIDMVMQGF